MPATSPGGRVQGSELLRQQLAQVTGHGLLAGAQGQAVHLGRSMEGGFRAGRAHGRCRGRLMGSGGTPGRATESEDSDGQWTEAGGGRDRELWESQGRGMMGPRCTSGPHLRLRIGLQPEQTAHLQGFSLDDSSPHEILRVGVHVVQEGRAKAKKLGGVGPSERAVMQPLTSHTHSRTHPSGPGSPWPS